MIGVSYTREQEKLSNQAAGKVAGRPVKVRLVGGATPPGGKAAAIRRRTPGSQRKPEDTGGGRAGGEAHDGEIRSRDPHGNGPLGEVSRMDMKQVQEMMARAQEMQEKMQMKMRETQVEASAGGGAVVVRMNGEKQVISVKIEKEAAADVEMLQDLVTAAVNEAARKVDAAMQSQMGGLLGGMGLPPGLF